MWTALLVKTRANPFSASGGNGKAETRRGLSHHDEVAPGKQDEMDMDTPNCTSLAQLREGLLLLPRVEVVDEWKEVLDVGVETLRQLYQCYEPQDVESSPGDCVLLVLPFSKREQRRQRWLRRDRPESSDGGSDRASGQAPRDAKHHGQREPAAGSRCLGRGDGGAMVASSASPPTSMMLGFVDPMMGEPGAGQHLTRGARFYRAELCGAGSESAGVFQIRCHHDGRNRVHHSWWLEPGHAGPSADYRGDWP